MEFGVVARWWVFFGVLLVAGLPVASRLLPDAPDRGASVAMPLSLVVVTLATLWVGQVAYGQLVVGGVFVAVLAAAAWLARGGVEIPRKPLLEVVGVFTVAFVFLIVVRAWADGVQPGGGEQFLDFGLLQALDRAGQLPPRDMWFAGERVVYYYGGQLMASIGAHLTDTAPRFAYEPALAGVYAMGCTAAYGLASTIAAGNGGEGRPVGVPTAIGGAGVAMAVVVLATGVDWLVVALPAAAAAVVVTRPRRVRAGVLGAFAFGFASNLGPVIRLLAARVDVVRAAVVAAGINADRRPAITPEAFDMWHASRFMETGLNEFPLFAYLNGDLHAHMVSVPVLFVAVAVGVAYYRTPARQRRRRWALLWGGFPVAGAAILTVNTWSLPTVFGVAALAVALADPAPATLLPTGVQRWTRRRSAVGQSVQRVLLAVGVAAVGGVLAVAIAWPFVQNVLLAGASNQHLAVLPVPSQAGALVFVHGLFLAAFGAYFVSRVATSVAGWVVAAAAAGAAVAVAVAVGPVVGGVGITAVVLVGPVLGAAWWLRRRNAAGVECVLVAAGAGLVVLVEYVYLADAASYERFNTVFKVYAQVWALWSVAGGVALAGVSERRASSRGLGAVFVVGLVVAASVYGGLAVTTHAANADDASLDALEYAGDAHPGEAAAARWLGDRRRGTRIIAAPGVDPYTWQNPAASLSGVPTVAGWAHAANYHSQAAWEQRVDDIGVVYETTDAASRAAILEKYDVTYVWVGPVERARYEIPDLSADPGIEPVHRTPAVTIYRVTDGELVAPRSGPITVTTTPQATATAPGAQTARSPARFVTVTSSASTAVTSSQWGTKLRFS
ncbi:MULTISPECIES: DUF2298 domain-containing protein [Halobacterium]|nr:MULTISPECIES: DUF2298 domain-containing protein [Halobacterium]MCF2165639.1 hypothetical protein [Halobacterium salinarum]MCF2168915.1 hypothetical protein [Halobacterium salinarum]MCF2238935.1 hypothetical protein [Halobacterium salinarum]QRY23125.1 DUF2298 domain-containing protein [Halobacterium sp. GSL-19]WJK64388.1 DUF2298 domain-containing protein [Halobacterium salinarum]